MFFGFDKLQHFIFGFLIFIFCRHILKIDTNKSLGLVLGTGISKEVVDSYGYGHVEFADVLATQLGAASYLLFINIVNNKKKISINEK